MTITVLRFMDFVDVVLLTILYTKCKYNSLLFFSRSWSKINSFAVWNVAELEVLLLKYGNGFAVVLD